jgi:hypothetical protein
MLNKMSYISGEKLQELTDCTVILNTKAYYFLSDQLRRTNTKCYIFNLNVSNIPYDLCNAKSVFVYTQMLDFFFDKIYPSMRNSFVLVTHNSDDGVSERYKVFLDGNKIIKWFGQNVEFEHTKLVPLPIGIANSQWPHGNLELLDKIRKENNPKTNLVYKNFEISTSSANRQHVNELTNANNIPMSSKVDQENYLRSISKSMYNICPRGNGIDCHRTWESLYLGTIPVVIDCVHNRGFQELPMLFVPNNDWNTITKSFLESHYQEMMRKIRNDEKLSLDYWRKRISKGE